MLVMRAWHPRAPSDPLFGHPRADRTKYAGLAVLLEETATTIVDATGGGPRPGAGLTVGSTWQGRMRGTIVTALAA